MFAGIKEFFEIESDEALYDKLTKAIQARNTLEAKKLIEQVKNTELFNKANASHNTLLHSAIEQGLEEVSEILISKMSNDAINIIEEYILSGEQKSETYLTLLASKGFGKACEMLIPRMYNETINTITKTNNTALTLVADKKLPEVCKMLISRMPLELINHINKAGDTAASVAAASISSKDTEHFKEVFDLLQEKQEEFLKITTIIKQNIKNSLTDLESVFNTNKKTLDVLFEKIQKLGDDKVDLLKIDKKIKDITNNNFISKKLTDLDNYVNCLVDNQKPQDETSKILGGVEGVPLE